MICGAHRVALVALRLASSLLSRGVAEIPFRLHGIGGAAFLYEKTRGIARLGLSGAGRRAERHAGKPDRTGPLWNLLDLEARFEQSLDRLDLPAADTKILVPAIGRTCPAADKPA